MSETPEQRRARLRAIGIKGGEATKARLAADPNYYKNIAAMGGRATRAVPKKKRRRKEPDGKMRHVHGAGGGHRTSPVVTPPPKKVTPSGGAMSAGTPSTAFDDLDAFMRGLAE